MNTFNFDYSLKKINYLRHKYLKLTGKSKKPTIHRFVAEYHAEQWENIDFLMNLLIQNINTLNNNIKNKNTEIDSNNQDDIRGNQVLKKFLPYMTAYYMLLQYQDENIVESQDANIDVSEDDLD